MSMSRLQLLSVVCGLLAGLVTPTWAWPLSSWLKGRATASADWQTRNWNTINAVYNLTVYPNQVPVFDLNGADAVPAGLFNRNVSGRVDPVGEFVGYQDSIEYFFALSPLPSQNGGAAAVTGYQITEFTSACANVAASVVYLFTSVVNPGAPNDGMALPTLKQVAFWKFDECGAILKYDAWIPNLQDWVGSVTGGGVLTDPVFQKQSILGLCALTELRCTGNNTQWTSLGECLSTLGNKTYGDYDEAWGDNIVCRSIHIVLTQVRPEVHCPHVGPTGGMKCVDVPYADQYFTDQTVFGDPLGSTFTCS